MDKTYNHKSVEDKIYEKWEKSGGFRPKDNPQAKPFTIIMPPPNANDPLHIGHAMFVTVEDILIRYHRMRGDASLWLPGTDHAGIETQYVYEKKLKKDGKSRFDFDRETLYKMIWDYVQQNSDIAVEHLKRIGASADWSRFTFTLDPKVVNIVLTTFQALHQQGLMYRDLRLINYCPRCGTGYSDLEVKHELRKDPFVYLKYGKFIIGTVRPETKFRDTALAVNPKDPRYKEEIGKTYEIMGLLGPITMKIIADKEVNPEFGTGMMKVTPAHDFHDFDLGKKHNLPVTPIIDFKGKMDFSWYLNQENFDSLPEKYKQRAKMYHGLHVSKARPLMIEHLKGDGLLVKVDENYEHTVSVCYRCGSLLEPLPLPQFFLSVKPMTEKVLKALEKGEVKIHGAGHDKILKHWLENLKDWNISRQIVWGIRLPIWYCLKENPTLQVTYKNSAGERVVRSAEGVLAAGELNEAKTGLQQLQAPIGSKYLVSRNSPGADYLQETDTFDTWFSSGQWPYATLLAQSENPNFQFPISNEQKEQYKDFNRFYPTQVMETGYDILPFWVMRMLMLGIHMTGKVPFEQVYFHGLVRDEKGQKMSKSKGNVISPLDIIDKYGADALRMALVMSTTAGLDSNTGEGKIRGMRNFTNKIWNAARFIILNQNSTQPLQTPEQVSNLVRNSFGADYKSAPALDNSTNGIPAQAEIQLNTDSRFPSIKLRTSPGNDNKGDKEFHKKLAEVMVTITKQLDDLKVGLAAETVYNEFWHWFCDEAIEQVKKGEVSITALTDGLKVFLKLLHPFVPFITEEIWSLVSENQEELLMNSRWPIEVG